VWHLSWATSAITKNADCFGNDWQKLDYILANIRHFKKVTNWIISTSGSKFIFILLSSICYCKASNVEKYTDDIQVLKNKILHFLLLRLL
jgi:hypothetical protein